MRILFKFPTRERPEKMLAHIANIKKYCISDDYLILLAIDEDDSDCNNPVVLKKIPSDVVVDIQESKNKIDAYNRGIDKILEWDILVVTSDDMEWTMRGFDNEIRADIKSAFPDLDGLLHYSDGNQKSNVCTLPIMTRKYYDRFKYVYHPSYTSLWCDNEQTDVAKQLGKYKYMGDHKIIFRHYHPAWGFGRMDELYKRNESRVNWNKDEKNYISRKEKNFDL